MKSIYEYLDRDSIRSVKHFDSKLDFLIKMLNSIDLKVKDHKNGGGGADNLFQVTDNHRNTFGLAIFVDRQRSGAVDRSLSIKIKSSFIVADIEMYKDNVIEFLQNNGIIYTDVIITKSTSSISGKPTKFPIITIHMKNKFCPWNN